MPLKAAKASTLAYLKLFRRCPENPAVPLDDWRMNLWAESLPDDYKYLTKVAYEHWLYLRYIYLKPAPEVIALLRNLRSKFMMALITNGDSVSQWEKIHNVHIETYFDCILVSGDLPWEKPNPEIFYSACKYLGVEPRQCAVIGDKLESDIQVCTVIQWRLWSRLNRPDLSVSILEILFYHYYCFAWNLRAIFKLNNASARRRRMSVVGGFVD